jgi:hypothetical protein
MFAMMMMMMMWTSIGLGKVLEKIYKFLPRRIGYCELRSTSHVLMMIAQIY